MSERIRFHLDENVDPDIALALRSQGIDITTTFDLKMAGKSDDEQLAFVCQEKRVLITHDTDFLKMLGVLNVTVSTANSFAATVGVRNKVEQSNLKAFTHLTFY